MDAFSSLDPDVKMQLGESAPLLFGAGSGRPGLRPPGPGMSGVRSVPVMPVPLQTELTGGLGDTLSGSRSYTTISPKASSMAGATLAPQYPPSSPVYSPSAPVTYTGESSGAHLPMEPLAAFLASPNSSPKVMAPPLPATLPTLPPVSSRSRLIPARAVEVPEVPGSPVRTFRVVTTQSPGSPSRSLAAAPVLAASLPVRQDASPTKSLLHLHGVNGEEAFAGAGWEKCDEGGSHRAGVLRRLCSSSYDVVNQRENYRSTKAAKTTSCFSGLFKHQDPVKKVDVLLVGGGIMSATLALLLKQLEPTWKIVIVERLSEVAQESSNGWNNAGTGHSALCEPNYTPEAGKGVDIHKAVTVNENFQLSRQYWAYLAQKGLVNPDKFISTTPHMTFAHGEEQIAWLKKRFNALKDHPLFQGMEYTEDPETMKKWAPLMMEGRKDGERCAFTRVPYGTDVDFGELTKELTKAFVSLGGDVQLMTEVSDFAKDESGLYDETWIVKTRKTKGLSRKATQYRARFVFIGAGGYALPLLQKTRIPEIRGFMGFPISGEFLVCQNPDLVERHGSKVYGKAAIGAPPMSVPHLDARKIGGKPVLLFGPFAGFSPRFLKSGSLMDIFKSLRLHNILPAAVAGLRNLDLSWYLLGQLLSTKSQKLDELRNFVPEAEAEDWSLVTAGQRVQIMKRDPKKTGVLQFGTEVISSDGLAGLLGASPGASTAVQVTLDVLASCFRDDMERWSPQLLTMIPSFGCRLSETPGLAETLRRRTAQDLQL